MKYTERFFRFPVRIYDRYSAEMSEEREKDMNMPIEGEWREGWTRLELDEFKTWSEYFDSEQGVKGVDEEGFLYTLIFSRTQGAFICTWPMKEFESRLDAFAEKFEEWQKVRIREKMQLSLPFPPENKV